MGLSYAAVGANFSSKREIYSPAEEIQSVSKQSITYFTSRLSNTGSQTGIMSHSPGLTNGKQGVANLFRLHLGRSKVKNIDEKVFTEMAGTHNDTKKLAFISWFAMLNCFRLRCITQMTIEASAESFFPDCEMRYWERAGSILWPIAAGFALYCLALTVLTGDIGFEGDDWWIFSWPYANSFPASVLAYAKASLRPVEGIYWIGLFEIFGFNKTAFNLFSLLLAGGACVMMGLCLSNAFPDRRSFVALATLFAFFLPTVSCLTYVLCTDNSRLTMLIFWSCAVAFQRWAMSGSSWSGLIAPVAIYCLAFLSYEASSFLIFVVPLLVWPVRELHPDKLSDRDFFIRIGAATVTAFLMAILIRFLLLGGGAVDQRHFFPPWELTWSYLVLLPFYLSAPFTSIAWDPWSGLFGVAVATCVVLLILDRGTVPQGNRPLGMLPSEHGRIYQVTLGLTILMLGILPYLLAGYGSIPPKIVDTVMAKWGAIYDGNTAWFNFNWSSRIYSAGSFGLAIVIAALLTGWRSATARFMCKFVAVIALGFMATFHVGLSTDWKEAAQIRNELISSLISQVPDVKTGTNFVFLDLESCHKRAPVFRGWGGLKELIRMLYDDHRLGAWYLYSYSWKWPNKLFHKAIVSQAGFVTRGMRLESPAPHDSLLILARRGSSLVLLDNITSHDGWAPTGILWRGASTIHSNLNRIVAWSHTDLTPGRLVKNAWNTGLIATLHLSKIKLGFRIANKWQSSPYHPRLRKSWMRK